MPRLTFILPNWRKGANRTRSSLGSLAAIAALIWMPHAHAEEDLSRYRCVENNPVLAGECYDMHGRIRMMVDGGVELWPVGTKRLLEVWPPIPGPNYELSPMPDRVRELARENNVFGDFRVCPYERQEPHAAQHVCVASAKNLVILKYCNDVQTPVACSALKAEKVP